MSEELQKRFLGYLDKLAEGINKGVDVATDTLPSIVRDFVEFRFMIEAAYLFFYVSIITFGIWAFRKGISFFSKIGEKDNHDERCFGLGMVSVLVGGIAIISMLFSIIPQAEEFFHVWKSPTTYLIVHMKEMFGK